ncbi:family 1 glycosylhydrolase, partial [Enterococcus sp. S181_ASV_20]|nr:family 1 glycosylhydrolase [Enterococcus sp. S181_ASV_20]
DGKKAVQVAYNIQLASAKAIACFKKVNPNPAGRIGIILNLTPAYPASQKESDLAAAEFADLWLNQLYMNASTLGEFPAALTERLAADG